MDARGRGPRGAGGHAGEVAEDRRVFDAVWERFLFRAVEGQAILTPRARRTRGGLGVDATELRARVMEALEEGDDGELPRPRASGHRGARARRRAGRRGGQDMQRIRRALDLPRRRPGDPLTTHGRPPRADRALRAPPPARLERARVARTGVLPPPAAARLDRALPTGPAADLAEVHRVVAQLKRRLATQGQEQRGHRRPGAVDVRRTIRASLETGGVPLPAPPPRRPRRPRLYVLCDVSTSVTSASVFFLSKSPRPPRRVPGGCAPSSSWSVWPSHRPVCARALLRGQISEAIAATAGVADVSGYTDYGRVWLELLGGRARTSTRARRCSCWATRGRTGATRTPRSSAWCRRRAGRVVDQPRAAPLLEPTATR